MRSIPKFISRVINKMGYSINDYTIIDDSSSYEEVKEDVKNGLDKGMVFIEGACVPNTVPNKIVEEYNSIDTVKVLTCDNHTGISIIINYKDESLKGINVQSLGAINLFLNELQDSSIKNIDKSFSKDFAPIKEILKEKSNELSSKDKEDLEEKSLKDYYRNCFKDFSDKKIGRKSKETLIKELKEAGFKI